MDSSRKTPRRRWCLPPAMLRDPDERLDGERILAESLGDLGLLLWRSVRDVVLWATTPPEVRGELFAPASADRRIARLAATEIPAAISGSVDTLQSMLTLASRADAETVSVCCINIASWARNTGFPHTAIAFAQAGALASPEDATAALLTGVCAAAAGQGARAETWLRRALGLARREKDFGSYAVAVVELGALCEARGEAERAERLYRSAYRSGRRYSIPSARLRAAHGLFRIMRARGDDMAAAQFALMATRGYDAEPGPRLVLDLAGFWTEIGEMQRARTALDRLVPFRADLPPADQLAALSLTARAWAGVRDGLREALEQQRVRGNCCARARSRTMYD